MQGQVTGAILADALLREMQDPARVRELRQQFSSVHRALRRGGAGLAAEAVIACARSGDARG
jgi:hypothetical protein